jgi:uncharacterized membrane protein YidH (DUF202 family)
VTTPDPNPHDRPPEDLEDLDPGLARARTTLAWRRTAISYAALGAALLKASPAVGALVLAASALIWGTGRMARSPGRAGDLESNQRRLLVVTVAVTSVAIAALVLALLAHSALPLR